MPEVKTAWNKGNFDNALIAEVNQIINSNPVRFTTGEIYRCLGNGYSYKGFHKHLMKARASGIVDSNRISEGRGGYHGGQGRKLKFKVGDKVRINSNRTPKYLTEELKRFDVPRTITSVFSARGSKPRPDTLYYLGNNRKGGCHLLEHKGFTTRQLILYIKGSVGRPKLKRRYSTDKPTNNVENRIGTAFTESPSITSVNGKKAS